LDVVARTKSTSETRTVAIPSDLYRELAEESALSGLTVDELVVLAIRYVQDDAKGIGARAASAELRDAPPVDRAFDEVIRLYEGE
jgi:hypothetical protein